MPQGTQKEPRSIQEMLEDAANEDNSQEGSELRTLKLELAKKEKLIIEQKSALEGKGIYGQVEGTPIVSKESLSNMVETAQGTRDVKEHIEAVPGTQNTLPEDPKKSKAAQAQKAALKIQLVDDIALISKLERPKQVKSLVMMALQKGLHYSFDVAKGLQNPYLLDEFHDALAIEMRRLLCERKKIKDC